MRVVQIAEHMAAKHQAMIKRVQDELTELNTKLTALVIFTKSDAFLKVHISQRELLQEQCRIMTRYAAILDDRVAFMTKPVKGGHLG